MHKKLSIIYSFTKAVAVVSEAQVEATMLGKSNTVYLLLLGM